jgi:hypothetical protein
LYFTNEKREKIRKKRSPLESHRTSTPDTCLSTVKILASRSQRHRGRLCLFVGGACTCRPKGPDSSHLPKSISKNLLFLNFFLSKDHIATYLTWYQQKNNTKRPLNGSYVFFACNDNSIIALYFCKEKTENIPNWKFRKFNL